MTQGVGVYAPQRGSGFASRLWQSMALFWQRAEPVELVEQRFNFLPCTFRWRGNVWRVRHIEAIHEQGTKWQQGRRYFRVLCQNDRSYVLYQDLRVGTWHLIDRIPSI